MNKLTRAFMEGLASVGEGLASLGDPYSFRKPAGYDPIQDIAANKEDAQALQADWAEATGLVEYPERRIGKHALRSTQKQ